MFFIDNARRGIKMARKSRYAAAILTPIIPESGARIGSECGPGEFARDNAGTVICQYEDRWGKHALVLMDAGGTRVCEGMNRGPGIGWHYL
ncbi:hypothetical protein P3T25_005144 [Paraburkholderia sp. GAS32]